LNRNQFLQATANPIDMQIIGLPGRAAVLREQTKMLGMNPDDVVPPYEEIMRKQKVMEYQQMMAMQAQQMMGGQPAPGQPGNEQPQIKDGERLQDGTPVTDTFSPR
jgi:hypothetical protein